MRFAQKEGKRILPNPLEKDAFCPLCNNPVLGKCGDIKVWHWAHKNLCECDSFAEPETEWHLNWKNNFPSECQEVIMNNHRADVKIKDIVIEFQNSPLSAEQIKERESFYGKVKWVLNGRSFASNLSFKDQEGYKSFRWRWPPQSWFTASCPIYIDMQPLVEEWINKLNKNLPYYEDSSSDDISFEEWTLRKKIGEYSNKLFLIKKVYSSLPCGGWGKLISKEDFIKECQYGYYRN